MCVKMALIGLLGRPRSIGGLNRMAKKTHVPKLLLLAHALCRGIAVSTPIIQRSFPENTAVLAALAAANAACAALGTELETLRTIGD
jgi:hypothetical protein